MTVMLQIDGVSRSIAVFGEVSPNDTLGPKRTKQWIFLDVMASLQLLEDTQNPKYDNFVH